MRIDLALPVARSVDVRSAAAVAESVGFDGAWVSEIRHDPFVAATLAVTSTSRIGVGTAVAVALARSPMTVAVQSHDLQVLADGRFRLGLGTQVRAHITRRFAMPWTRPVDRMREYVGALRAIWASWTDGSRLDFRGEFYEHTLMPPAFVPRPTAPMPPILLSGVGPQLTRLATEVADGFICHAFTTSRYRTERTLPTLGKGRGGTLTDFTLVGTQMVATGTTEEEMGTAVDTVREQIAFYSSTPAYRPVLEVHGYEELGDELHRLSVAGRWSEMGALVDDDLLREVAVVAEPGDVVAAVEARWGPPFTAVSLHLAVPPDDDLVRAVGVGLSGRQRVGV